MGVVGCGLGAAVSCVCGGGGYVGQSKVPQSKVPTNNHEQESAKLQFIFQCGGVCRYMMVYMCSVYI